MEKKYTYSLEYQIRSYRYAVFFLLWIAVRKLWPEADLIVRSAVNGGLYMDVQLPGGIDAAKLEQIKAKMRELVAAKLPIEQRMMKREEAVRLFQNSRQLAKAKLLGTVAREELQVLYCDGIYECLSGDMPPTTESLDKFELDLTGKGLLLRTPLGMRGIPGIIEQPKLSHVLQEGKEWAKILHCEYLADMNELIRSGKAGGLIRVSEAMQEKKIAQIADNITTNISKARVILIAGPSSSGKTSFTQRLKVQLQVNGLQPVCISLDDYYLAKDKVPRLPDGSCDWESLQSLDVPLFNEHLTKLLAGEKVVLPHYDFKTSTVSFPEQNSLCMAENQPLLIEGIHGLNEALTGAIPREQKYKIYVSALLQLTIDMHNRIPTTEARLIRRIVRDAQFRNYDARKTLLQWPEVRAGEEKNIFPYQEDADIFFNSALIYELAVLTQYAKEQLQDISPEEPIYAKAQLLLRLCSVFAPLPKENEADIPCNSLLREFLGGSCFFDSKGDLKE